MGGLGSSALQPSSSVEGDEEVAADSHTGGDLCEEEEDDSQGDSAMLGADDAMEEASCSSDEEEKEENGGEEEDEAEGSDEDLNEVPQICAILLTDLYVGNKVREVHAYVGPLPAARLTQQLPTLNSEP